MLTPRISGLSRKEEPKDFLKDDQSSQQAWRWVQGSESVGAGVLGQSLHPAVAKSPDKPFESSMLHSGAGKWFWGDIYLFRHILICGK